MNVALEAGVAIYVALIVALAVWAGVFIYLWRLDAQSASCNAASNSNQPQKSARP